MFSLQIFENKGAVQGCSNPHPHCQVCWPNPNQIFFNVKVKFLYVVIMGNIKCYDTWKKLKQNATEVQGM